MRESANARVGVKRTKRKDNEMDLNHNTSKSSPQVYARIGGLLYLIMIILGIIEEVAVRAQIFVPGNPAGTAANLRSMETLWRFGIAGELLMAIIAVSLAQILYVLTRPAGKNLALLALFFGLVATTVGAAYTLQLIEALFPLGNAEYLKVFTQEQLNTFAYMAYKSHSLGYGISLLLFGPFFFVTGYLIFRSGYFPKTIGALYLIPGVSYLVSSLALILVPVFAAQYYFIIAGPALIGELSLCLWLLVKGVNIEKWELKESLTP